MRLTGQAAGGNLHVSVFLTAAGQFLQLILRQNPYLNLQHPAVIHTGVRGNQPLSPKMVPNLRQVPQLLAHPAEDGAGVTLTGMVIGFLEGLQSGRRVPILMWL